LYLANDIDVWKVARGDEAINRRTQQCFELDHATRGSTASGTQNSHNNLLVGRNISI
jgi:hypothetical protein